MYKYDSNDDYKNDVNIIYNFNDTYDKDDLYKILNKYIPNQDTIIQNYYYKNIFDHIYNYDDFSKVCIRYNLNIDNITQVNKLHINTILDKNIIKYYEYYNKNYKNLVFKSENISIKNIPQIVKLLNLRNFIHKQTNIVYQNYLYDKFALIDLFFPSLRSSERRNSFVEIAQLCRASRRYKARVIFLVYII